MIPLGLIQTLMATVRSKWDVDIHVQAYATGTVQITLKPLGDDPQAVIEDWAYPLLVVKDDAR